MLYYAFSQKETIVLPRRADSPAITDTLCNYTPGIEWDIRYVDNERHILIGAAEPIDSADKEYAIRVREEGISLHQFIMRERAARARELITASGRSFTEIAELCGFSSPSHLSRAIRAEYGVTPSMMRKTQ